MLEGYTVIWKKMYQPIFLLSHVYSNIITIVSRPRESKCNDKHWWCLTCGFRAHIFGGGTLGAAGHSGGNQRGTVRGVTGHSAVCVRAKVRPKVVIKYLLHAELCGTQKIVHIYWMPVINVDIKLGWENISFISHTKIFLIKGNKIKLNQVPWNV